MFITRVKICPLNPEGMRALDSPHIMHGVISNSFPGGYDRNTTGKPDPGKTPLWRVDSKGKSRYLLILSNKMPDKEYLANHLADQTEESVEIKEYDKVFEKIDKGTSFAFKTEVNPTVCKTDENGVKRRVPLLPASDERDKKGLCSQEDWLNNQAEKAGFSVDKIVNQNNIKMIFQKGSKTEKVTFLKTTFEGILTVTDKAKFIETLKAGIGREKAYGCGMLSIATI